MLLDVDTCVTEARVLHPSSDGWFTTFRKVEGRKRPITKAYPLDRLEDVVRLLDKTPDAYMSQGDFLWGQRKVVAFKSINCAWVDIDCYKDTSFSAARAPDEGLVREILANARDAGIPEPSYVTYSGRGIYCKWVFDKPISAHQLARWQALQSVLTPLYTAFGVDASARDAARVLRVMGSTHSATGNTVRVAHNSGVRHDFDTLCRLAEAVDITKLRWPTRSGLEPGVARRIRKSSELLLDDGGDLGVLEQYSQSRQPLMLRHGSRDALNWNRFIDLRRLAEIRGGILPGSRDIMMFWMATFLGHAGVVTSQNFSRELTCLMAACSGKGFDPLADGSMQSLIERLKDKEAGRRVRFKGGDYSALYTPTNDHLIDVLAISPEEQREMVTIISAQEKLRRADAKVPGREERRRERVEWRALALDLARQATEAGRTPSPTMIASVVGKSKGQVSKLLTGKLQRQTKPAGEQRRRRGATQAKNHGSLLIREGLFHRHAGKVSATPEQRARPEVLPTLRHGASNPWSAVIALGRSISLDSSMSRLPRPAAAASAAQERVRAAAAAPAVPPPLSREQIAAQVKEGLRLSAERAQAAARERERNQQLLEAQRAQAALQAVQRMEAIRRRAMGLGTDGAEPAREAASPATGVPPARPATTKDWRAALMATAADNLERARRAAAAREARAAGKNKSPAAADVSAQPAQQPVAPAQPTVAARPEVQPQPAAATPPENKPRVDFASLAQRSGALRRELDAQEQALHAKPAETGPAADPAWDDPSLPAGSKYSQAEWDAAREGGRYYVFEVRAGSEGALMRAEKPQAPAPRRTVVDGKLVVHQDPPVLTPDHIEPTLGLVLDGCLILGPKAPTSHPGAASGHITLQRKDGSNWQYRVVRPLAHLEQEDRRWMATFKAVLPEVVLEPVSDVGQAETSPVDRPRG